MNDDRLAEIEKIAHMYDYVTELVKAFRAERAKVAELEKDVIALILELEKYSPIKPNLFKIVSS